MTPVTKDVPEIKHALQIAERALRGEQFRFEDYRSEMIEVQKKWTLGGHVTDSHGQWQALFGSNVSYHHDLTELKNGLDWEWDTEEKQKEQTEKYNIRQAKPRTYQEHEQRSRRAMEEDGRRHGYVSDVAEPGKRGFLSSMFSKVKPDGSLRWMQDLKGINRLMRRIAYKMHTDRYICTELPRNAWMTTWDYSKYYWLFRLSKASRRIQRFWDWSGTRQLECPVAAMGHKQAQQKCCKYSKMITDGLKQHGWTGMSYVDEVLSWIQEQAEAYIMHMIASVLTHCLGIPRAWAKDVWIPTRVIDFLGWAWDTKSLRRHATKSRFDELRNLALKFWRMAMRKQSVTLKEKASLMGVLISMTGGTRNASLLSTPLKKELKEELNLNQADYTKRVLVNQKLIPTYRTIASLDDSDNWNWLRRGPPTWILSVDASEFKWGGQVIEPKKHSDFETSDFFSKPEQDNFHHNVQEKMGFDKIAKAVVTKFKIRGTLLNPIDMSTETDNKAVMCVCCKAKSGSLELARRHIELRKYLDSRYIRMWSTWVSGEFMINQRRTDLLSRRKSRWYEWRIKWDVFRYLTSTFGIQPDTMIDLFCEGSTMMCTRGVTRSYTSTSLWQDAYSRSWSPRDNHLIRNGDVLYAYPPPRLLPQLILRLRDENIQSMIAIVPVATNQSWFHEMIKYLIAKPIILPPLRCILTPPEGRSQCSDTPPLWALAAMHLSTDGAKRAAYVAKRSRTGDGNTLTITNRYVRSPTESSRIARAQEKFLGCLNRQR